MSAAASRGPFFVGLGSNGPNSYPANLTISAVPGAVGATSVDNLSSQETDGIEVDTTNLTSDCGLSVSCSSATFFVMTGGEIPAGGTCTVTAGFTPTSNPGGRVILKSGSGPRLILGGAPTVHPLGPQCRASYSFRVPAAASPGTYALTTTTHSLETIASNVLVLDPVSASFEVVANIPRASLSATFPDGAKSGSLARIVYTIAYDSPFLDLTDLRLVDRMDGDFAGATISPDSATGCGGGVLSGGLSLTLQGGSLPTPGSCTIGATITLPPGVAGQTLTDTLGALRFGTTEQASGVTA